MAGRPGGRGGEGSQGELVLSSLVKGREEPGSPQEEEIDLGVIRRCLHLPTMGHAGIGRNAVSMQEDSNNSRLRVLPKFRPTDPPPTEWPGSP